VIAAPKSLRRKRYCSLGCRNARASRAARRVAIHSGPESLALIDDEAG
jgi:hypothetical protein